jgi:cell division protein FtsN
MTLERPSDENPTESPKPRKPAPGNDERAPFGSNSPKGLDSTSGPDNLLENEGFSPDHLGSAQSSAAPPVTGQIDHGAETSKAGDDRHGHEVEDDEDLWAMDDETEPMTESGTGWPMGLVAVAIVAVLLLVFGGYGVMQERAGLREEIRRLQAELGTSAMPEETARARQALRTMEQRNDALRASVANLQLENRRLQASVADLQAQLSGQRQVPATADTAGTQTKPQPALTEVETGSRSQPNRDSATGQSEAVANAEKSTALQSGWFVNFSSYSQRSDAESWAGRLDPISGTVVIAAGEKNGKTFYRVRVVGLKSEAEAKATAASLEREYNLSRLWVGRQ